MQRSWLNELTGLSQRRRSARPRVEELEAKICPAPLVVTDMTGGVTPTQMVNSLLGAGVTATNITYTGDPRGAGMFTGGSGVFSFDTGLVLGSGQVVDTAGTPPGTNSSGSISTILGSAGDTDLDALITPDPTSDAAILQFDFIPQGGTLTFDYVFSSDEYNEFAPPNSSAFNDVFAFFLNGSNVALIPNTSTPVSINNVNPAMNTSLYIDNETSGAVPFEMDGLTVTLTVTATVNPGVVNRIKLAIADGGDSSFDSSVFIRAGSFTAPIGPQAPLLTAYRPLRYAFRSLEQNLGQEPPLPVAGGASEASFDGNLTILNVGGADAVGDIKVTLRRLPAGVTLLNASGNEANGDPFIIVKNNALAPGGTVPLRVPVKFSNPNLASLGTVFVGPYDIVLS